MNPLQSLPFFLPESILVVTIILLITLNLWKERSHFYFFLFFFAILGSVLAFIFLSSNWNYSGSLFSGLYIVDSLGNFFKAIFLISTLLITLIIYRSTEVPNKYIGEFLILLFSVTLGMFLFISTTNLLMLYLSLEFISITSYLLTGFKRTDKSASEAALKYVIYGGVASGIMLFGISYLYGMTGSLQLESIREILLNRTAAFAGVENLAMEISLLTAVIFVFAGLAYKIAAVPFHMWCPDVYEGAPTPFTAFLSVAPKIAGLTVLVRFIFTGFIIDMQELKTISELPIAGLLVIVSIATMTLGNLSAISQNNLKRLLAYSSIAHCGYFLMGLSTLTEEGISAFYLYSLIYLLMNMGAFFVIIAIRERTGSEELDEYRGLVHREPFLAVAFGIFLFSLTGLPPFAGFIGKFYIFAAVLKKGGVIYYVLAIIGVINSVISLYYYARVLKAMFLEKGKSEELIHAFSSSRILILLLTIPVLILGVYWQPVTGVVNRSLHIEKVVQTEVNSIEVVKIPELSPKKQ